MMYYDWTFIILIPAILFTLYAQAKVKGNFEKYSKIQTSRRITGKEAARKVLDSKGLTNIQIRPIHGNLTDNYNPKEETIFLSENVIHSTSIAAVGVACHEAGHAIQDAEDYAPINIRNSIVPVVNIASMASWPLAIVGIMLLSSGNQIGDLVFTVAVLAFVGVIAFHLVTLPVELNASKRALTQLEELGIVMGDEKRGAKKVLDAAAMTYIAALAMAVLNLIRILALRNSRD